MFYHKDDVAVYVLQTRQVTKMRYMKLKESSNHTAGLKKNRHETAKF